MFYIEKLYLSKVGLNFVHFGINMKEWLWGKYFFTDEQKKKGLSHKRSTVEELLVQLPKVVVFLYYPPAHPLTHANKHTNTW